MVNSGCKLSIALICAIAALPAYGKNPRDAPRLPAARGNMVVVSEVEGLYRAVANLRSDTTIVLQRGIYQLQRPLQIGATAPLKNVALRGATGNFHDVVIRGAGMGNHAVAHGILAENTEGLLIADVTIGWVQFHPIALSPGNLQKPHIYHCRLVDAGEQFLKVSLRDPVSAIHDGIVEYCQFEYTTHGPANGYTNGVDILGGHNWIVRHNLFRNLRSARGGTMTGPAVLAWQGAENTRCEQNTFLNCDRPIAFGLMPRKAGTDHRGGIIANNFIVTQKEAVPHADAAICVWDSPGTKVLHNTILLGGAYPNAIEARWPHSKDILVANNLCDGQFVGRDGATLVERNNQASLKRQMVKDRATGDLHLTPHARPSLVASHPDSTRDFDDENRPATTTSVGADEPVGGRLNQRASE